jgi:hypothetical protein
MFLTLALLQDGEHLGKYFHEGTEYSVLSVCWISPLAPSVLNDNEVDGLVMDTTFTVIGKRLTAILMAVSRNGGTPIVFVFGGSECTEMYDLFYTIFHDYLVIGLAKYIHESDQGPTLMSVGAWHRRHLLCLRYLLATLTEDRVSDQVGNLVKCRSEKELEIMTSLYQDEFARIRDGGGGADKQLRECLRKVGLAFTDGSILCENRHR